MFDTSTVNACANREWQSSELRRAHARMQVDNKAADKAKGDLRHRKPEPVDALVENGADDTDCRVQHRRKNERHHENGRDDRKPREHREQCTVEQAYEPQTAARNSKSDEK